MSFEVPEPIITLEFGEDTKYPGLSVRTTTLPSGQFFNLIDAADALQNPGANVTVPPEIREMFRAFGDHLVSWNLTRKGEPVPATKESLDGLDVMFVLDLVMAWLDGFQSVPGPLEDASNSGATSQVPQIPMEPLSPNPLS